MRDSLDALIEDFYPDRKPSDPTEFIRDKLKTKKVNSLEKYKISINTNESSHDISPVTRRSKSKVKK